MNTVNKKKIRSQIRDYLSQQDDVIFVYLFGSFVGQGRYRDIDIGVYMDHSVDLVRLGHIKAGLDKQITPKVDLVLLNDIPDKKPAFGFQVITEGELLINKDISVLRNFQERMLHHYFDTAYLRKKMDKAFDERVATGKFALRDYE